MDIKFNYFGEHENINIFLCNPNKKKICSLNFGMEKNLTLTLNQLSEFSIVIPKQINMQNFEYYSFLEPKRIILLENIGYFLITEVSESGDGIVEKKTITASSLEAELNYKRINLLDGVYKFYDILNPKNTLLYKILSNTNWKVEHVDSELLNLYRTFEIPDSTIYDFLLNDVENSYECVFIFNSFTRSVSAYTLENVTKKTDIVLSYNNLIKSIDVNEKTDNLVTALNVYGGNDLSIYSVNPLGTSTIYNFDFYKTTNWMTENLLTALNNWEEKISQNKEAYSSYLVDLKDKNVLLTTAQSDLSDLQAEYDSIEGVIKVMIEGGQQNTDSYTAEIEKLNNTTNQITNKKTDISNLETEITLIKTNISTINSNLSFENNFSESDLDELNSFIIENTYQNDSFITSTTMTNSEIQDVTQTLYDQGVSVLKKLSTPRFEFSLNSVNFLFLKEFQYFSEQLELGSIIRIEKEYGVFVYPILLSINIRLDDPTTFNLEFGNRFRLDSSEYTYADLFSQAVKSSSNVQFDGAKWGEYVNSGMNNTVTTFINSSLDASKNSIINASNQEIVINQNGLRGRTATSTGYDPNQVWLTSNTLAFTKNNWETASLALGQINFNGENVFGLVAEVLVGNLVAGNQLQITNDSNNFLLDSNGAVLKNATFSIISSNERNQILLDPTNGIKIRGRTSIGSSWSDKLSLDSNGNIILTGNITATSGSIAGWTISTDKLINTTSGDYIGSNGYGKLSLLSWTPSTATFNGRIYASNLGDQIQTTNIANGSVTSQKLDTLYASKAYVDSINADVAVIGNVLATKVDANYVAANYATIGSLNATNANIANLWADKLSVNQITNPNGQLGIVCKSLIASTSIISSGWVIGAQYGVIDGSVSRTLSLISMRRADGGTAYCLGYIP